MDFDTVGVFPNLFDPDAQLQNQGRSKRDAVIEAVGLRLRPIMMTTGAMILGAVPLAIATGAGAESHRRSAG